MKLRFIPKMNIQRILLRFQQKNGYLNEGNDLRPRGLEFGGMKV
jgi:hypothetical protein